MSGGGGGGGELTQTPQMKEQAQINAKLWNWYQQYYKPLITKYAERVISPEQQEAEKRQVAGQINAEIMKNIQPETASLNPVQTAKTLSNLGKMEAGTQVKGQGAVKSRQLGEVQNIINIGRGEATEAQAGMGAMASQSLAAEIEAERLSQESKAAQENLIGSAIGLGTGAIYGGMTARNKSVNPTPRTLTYNPAFDANYYDEWNYGK